jgi:hypothetical protein
MIRRESRILAQTTTMNISTASPGNLLGWHIFLGCSNPFLKAQHCRINDCKLCSGCLQVPTIKAKCFNGNPEPLHLPNAANSGTRSIGPEMDEAITGAAIMESTNRPAPRLLDIPAELRILIYQHCPHVDGV